MLYAVAVSATVGGGAEGATWQADEGSAAAANNATAVSPGARSTLANVSPSDLGRQGAQTRHRQEEAAIGRKDGNPRERAGAEVQLLADEPTPENMFTPANGDIRRNSSDQCPEGMVGSCNDCFCCCSTPPFMGLTVTEYVPDGCSCSTQMHGSLGAVLVIAALVASASCLGACWFGRRCCWQPYRLTGSREERGGVLADSTQVRYNGDGLGAFLS